MTDEIQEVAQEEIEATETVEAEKPEVEEAEGEKETPQASSDDEEGPKPKTRHQRRKEQMQRIQADLEAKEKALSEAEARLQEIEQHAGTVPPKQDDFETYEDFQAALSAHHAMRMMDDRQKAEYSRQAETHRQERARIEAERQAEIAQGWQSQVQDALERYADFDKVALNPAVPITPQIATMLASMDAGADVAYHLGMNMADARRIALLPDLEAAMELGRIEARLSVPKANKVTNAPDPVHPVKSASSVDRDWTKMSPEEYDEWRAGGGIPT